MKIFASLLLLSLSAQAAVTLPAVFSDHMVLQSGKPVPVWGMADANEEVTVAIAGQKKTTKADAKGQWSLKLDALAVAAEPQTLTIGEKTIKDVLIGEVWLGSGQSNMGLQVQGANDYEGSKAAANVPLIRVFTESSPSATTAQAVGKGSWVICSPEAVGHFSATLYFFGRNLYDVFKQPLGLINSSVGGTPIESWISPEAQQGSAELKPFYEALKQEAGKFDEAKAMKGYEREVAKWAEEVKMAKAAGTEVPRKPRDPLETRKRKGDVGGLFNGKISPLIPYAIRGAIWYQGEANSVDYKAPYYQSLLTLLAKDWRGRWNDEFPFAWVQLPNFTRAGEGWPIVREQMLNALSTIPNSGMAITIDIGDAKNIHPTNKQEVGRRLSLWALGAVYHKDVADTSGPLIDTATVKGGEFVLTFKHAKGLKAKGALTEFEVAGADGQWQPADAKIEGETVVVSAKAVAEPKQVRYAWKDNPVATLFNGADIPASPFRK
ncbi:sialate O-acetylesterase [Prosthecobacter sp.]|uniref:sialate O-acetylesterase n=1 Tax=Prosthecobacter sp. TaxID=1965333 RepID=UPI002486D2DD|nr:sialate O-acetylesterase [Prosthecobacter sp.]MDI1313482.1 sialate O-acetylesterase [Prosthecobacter sp.]